MVQILKNFLAKLEQNSIKITRNFINQVHKNCQFINHNFYIKILIKYRQNLSSQGDLQISKFSLSLKLSNKLI